VSSHALGQENPNINFGLWETTATTTITSEQFNMPGESTSTTDCVTQQDFEEGLAFMDDSSECAMEEEDLRDDGANYRMVCNVEQMGEMTMTVALEFGGDTMSGVIEGDIESPMGMMQMKIDMAGKRLGDCQ
jgi:hypothetical protein